MHNFRKLSVYSKALMFNKLVRSVTRKFPKDEIYSLTSQFRRAADSIVLNVSEGAGNRSNKEFAKFLDYSIRSGHECVACSDIAITNEYINETIHQELFSRADEIIAMLVGLQRSLLR